MLDKTILVTGGTGGIGKQTAISLAKMGAQVIVTGRSQTSGKEAVEEIKQLSGNDKVDVLLADLSTQAGVRSLADQFRQKYSRLDVLINNAGLVEPQRRVTEDGVEAVFAVNVVAPFLLTHLLLDNLKASPAARVITLTGGGVPDKLDVDNIQGERSYTGLSAYGHSKLVMMISMYEFAQRMQGTNVTVNVCFPGGAATNMVKNVTPDMMPGLSRLAWPLFRWMMRPDGGKSAAKASRSSVYLASSPEVEGVTGKYYDTNSKLTAWPAPVLDARTRQQVWTIVEQAIRIEFEYMTV